MDAERFDSLTRLLSADRSRRGVTRLVSGLVLSGPLVVLSRAETQAKGKKHKKHKKRRGRPLIPPPVSPPPPPGSPPPPAFSCQGQSDNTPCNGDGRCLLGQCNPRPICTVGDGTKSCPAPPAPPCCGTCVPIIGKCFVSTSGQPCYESADCFGGLQCVGYVCLSTTCAPTANVCGDFGAVCGLEDTGGCVLPVDGGPSRCGGTLTDTCGCTSHQDCAGLGRGAFCAQTPAGSLCGCSPTTATRCVLPG